MLSLIEMARQRCSSHLPRSQFCYKRSSFTRFSILPWGSLPVNLKARIVICFVLIHFRRKNFFFCMFMTLSYRTNLAIYICTSIFYSNPRILITLGPCLSSPQHAFCVSACRCAQQCAPLPSVGCEHRIVLSLESSLPGCGYDQFTQAQKGQEG